jgi:hypothetical protein
MFSKGWLVLCLATAPLAAQQVSIQAGGDSASYNVGSAYGRVRLIITGPSGQVFEQYQNGAGSNAFRIDTRLMPDGHYNYRLDFSTTAAIDAVDTSAPSNADGRAQTAHARAPAPAEQSGTFLIERGLAFFPKPWLQHDDQDESGRPSKSAAKDQVIADDLIVQGSACIGLDCVNNESFGFDTIRMKENNTRIKFEDTSTGAFPTSDWQLTANDSASGGLNKFSIEDITGARVPLTVEGDALTNSIYVDSTGKIGFRTSTPVLDLHVTTGDTPAHRLEQTNASGFTAQTWDVAGNEANFFVRDVTSGSRLPFRIRPGAPTSSIDVSATGNVGVGTASPTAKLEISKAVDLSSRGTILLRVTNPNYGTDGGIQPEDYRFEVDSNGNVTARGTITQLSSRTAKEGFEAVNGAELLAKVDSLPISTWRYQQMPDRHLGPVAEDFYQAFGLGQTDKTVALSDVAGVALAAVKALQDQVQQRDARIQSLEQRLSELEARLAR